MKHVTKTTVVLLLLFAGSCKKHFDHPPLKELGEGEKVSIAHLRSKVGSQPSMYRFTGDTSLYCTITADESSGSFYRRVFVVDDEGSALAVNLLSSGGLYVGDYIRILLNGTTVIHANEFYSLDSVTREKHIVKISSGNRVIAQNAGLAQVLASVAGADLQSKLVEINNVEFVFEHRNILFGDAIGKSKTELTLTDCQSNTITLSVSGFANFASKKTPSGNGKFTGIVTRYNNSIGLELRNYDDVLMAASACTGSASAIGSTFAIGPPVLEVNENFNSVTDLADIAAAGWINYCETGKTKWKGNVKAGIYKTGKITAFGAGQQVVSWLISPAITYDQDMKLSFKTGAEYFKTGHLHPVMAYVCTNLDGSNMKTANWTAITTATYVSNSDGSYSGAGGLRNSGEIHLKDLPLLYNYSGTFFVGFKYTGEPGFDTNIYLDDVVIK